MRVERVELPTAAGPAVFDDDVPAKVGRHLIRDRLDDGAIINTEHIVVWDERRFNAGVLGPGRAIGEQHRCCLPGRSDVDGRDVAASVEPPTTVAGPPRFAVIGIHTGPGERAARRRPDDADVFAAWQRCESLIGCHAKE